MIRSRVCAFFFIALCATPTLADVGILPAILAAAGNHERQYRPNNFNPRPSDRNEDAGNGQRGRQNAYPPRGRNEEFGYGFERRQERSDRSDSGRERN